MNQSIHFVQFTNPAAYPPTLHATRILAEAGWSVNVLGVAIDSSETFRAPTVPGVQTTLWPNASIGRARHLQYARFVATAIARIAEKRPKWVYASDPFAAPIAVAVKQLGLAKVVYHEHDAPGQADSRLLRPVLRARLHAARTADLLVVPNQERLSHLVALSGRTGESLCVWNVPSGHEVSPPRLPLEGPPTLYYHGTINPDRIPLTVLEAMTRVSTPLRLSVVGYETVGSLGYYDAFRKHAIDLGLEDRVTMLGPMDRGDLMCGLQNADIGISFMPLCSEDLNMSAMVGASNKAFDYLAGGLAVVVSDLPAWRHLYVQSGYGVAANPCDIDSLVQALDVLAADVHLLRRMGEAGRQRIAFDWNYENQFQRVVENLLSRR